ncbi:MAG: 5-(carboxyamino)imidazole ribonucleotide mutase [Phycisphaerae bacterium]|nr:5-(carboxyamino)imidazole ribonucleotide mutase [Phycisphaerae bacterium]
MACRVAIIMGSESDWPVMRVCYDQLAEFGIEVDVQVLSAHRTPDRVAEYAAGASGRGVRVMVAGAGMSAALPGAIAAHTCLPVIGVPVASGALQGVDALLAISQMPPGVPVATMAIGKAGARNAAVLAGQILALSDEQVAQKLQEHRRSMGEKADKSNQALREELKGR